MEHTQWTDSSASRTGIRLERLVRHCGTRRRRGRTFDVVGQVPGNHFVQQFGHALDNRRLEHIAGISADTSLTNDMSLADFTRSLREIT